MLFDIHNIIFEELVEEYFTRKDLKLTVARLDKMHPVVSGNKLFKLHYFLDAFKKGHYKSIETFGGAYSNHLVATAFACRELSIPCKGTVRGEQPAFLSHTLQQCLEYGMELEFISRQQYEAVAGAPGENSKILIIPEGGYHPLGAKGASHIMDAVAPGFSHIAMAVGTSTTLAGILQKTLPGQQVIAIPVLKGLTDIHERLNLLNGRHQYDNLDVWDQYHFGGYAKKTPGLLDFMNRLYARHQLPTDFVYTAKMMFGVMDAINADRFGPGSNILCLHTGGLQGNGSLAPGSLIY